jgi:dedicated sortase system histidine kinase
VEGLDREEPPQFGLKFGPHFGPRFGLRAKLALVALVLLALPLAGTLYVNEVERFLLQSQEQTLLGIARAVATALHERPQLLASASGRDEEVDAILLGLQRSSSRLWVVDRNYQVIASAGSLRRASEVAAEAPWWQPLVGWLIERPTEEFSDARPEDILATGPDIAAALQGTPATSTRRTRDGRAVVMSAAHPIWNGDEVVGAVVAEETTNPAMSVKSAALERLLLLTLAAFATAGVVLIAFATRLSMRIRRLRDEAESAIDAHGRIRGLASGSDAGDEIGDLSRSFSAVLERLAQHHAYLESMAGRLSHELRTPIAVVRSSLENLKLAPAEAGRYIARAEEGLQRLNRILERMTEASRLEQSLRTAERERYDLAPVVRGCVEGYRVAYPRAAFVLDVPEQRVGVDGSPDLAAQLLDKLVENAVDFSRPGEPVRVSLDVAYGEARLTVANKGPLLPAAMRGRLFDSMISVREAHGAATPHLGIGLYVARLIAEFHGGGIGAANLPDGDGVAIGVRFPLVSE